LYIPILRKSNVTGVKPEFWADPRLNVTFTMAAANSTSAGDVFKGYWSSSNGSYVVMFKLSTPGMTAGQLELKSYNTSATNDTLVRNRQGGYPFMMLACKQHHSFLAC
jgi:hypothetical protein